MTPEYVDYVAGFVLAVIDCLLVTNGIVLNVFIVIVNCKKSHPLQAVDLIITSLAMVRILLLCLYIQFIFGFLSVPPVIHTYIPPEYAVTLTMSVEFCSLWWGSVLCVFYCVKITNYSNRLFMRLNMKISKMVPRLLIFSLVPSILCSLSYKWFVFSHQSHNGTDGQTGGMKINWFNTFIIGCAGSIIPFIIFCISAGLLILSLLRHTRHLGGRGSGFSDAQRDVHLSVIWNMISFLFFYVLYFLGSNLFAVSFNSKSQLFTVLCVIFYTAFPSLHSISIIVSNRELKDALIAVLRCSQLRD